MKSSNHHFVPISLKRLNFHSKEFFDTHLSLKPKPNHWVGNPTDLRRLWKVYLMGTWGGVAYHLDAQAGRSTRFGQMVRKLKFRTGQFRSASRLPFLQISSIYQKTIAKAWNQERCLFSLAEIGIKDGFEEMDEFPFAMLRSEK